MLHVTASFTHYYRGEYFGKAYPEIIAKIFTPDHLLSNERFILENYWCVYVPT